ncbi:MAG: winged helix-turn-helix domain-containing protein [Dokdonella sp.]
METAAARWMAFDVVTIDVTGHRLFVNEKDIALEPKAFAVLLLLAREPGRVFSRDEILDTVWGHRHVTTGVLSRVVTLLRHALDDNAGESRYLSTVHGIGYRFDAQVRTAASRGELAADKVAAAVGRVEMAPPELTTPSAATAEPVSVSPLLDPHKRARSSRHGFMLPLLLIAALLLFAGYWHIQHNRTMDSKSPTLVVLPLHTVGMAQDENTLAEGLSEELITRLSHVDGLHLISITSAALAQSGKFDLSQLADKLKVTHALEGSVREDGDQLRINLRLIEVPEGKTLWAQDYDRSIAHVFALESDIAQAVSGALALRLGLAAPATATATAGDNDPELFREYLAARRAHRNEDLIKSAALLRAVIAKAPDYARAHALLARILVTSLRPTLSPPVDIDAGRREATRALELDPNLAEAQTALAIIACRAADWAHCVELFKHALTLDPTDSDCRSLYAYWLAGMGYLKEALDQAEIGWASDPLNLNSNFVRGRVLDTLGRHDDAKPFFGLASSSTPRRFYAMWFNAVWRHDYAAAREFAGALPEREGFRESSIAVTEALVDPSRLPQTIPLIDASERNSGRPNSTRLMLPNPDFSTVVPALESELRNGLSSGYLLLWMPEYSALRRDPAFQDFLKRNHIIDYWRAHGWPSRCKADGDGATCM